jgi:hypothetical protein
MRTSAPLRKGAYFAAALVCLTLLVSGSDARADEIGTQQRWHFDVQLDGRRIGAHDFTVEDDGSRREVVSHARFDLRVLSVPLYHYEHWDREEWSRGCLRAIAARTTDGGRGSLVQGELDGERFELTEPHEDAALPGCIMTYAYWDPAILAQSRLLNAQTGRYEAVAVRELDPQTISVGGRAVNARHYALDSQGHRIELWYSPTGQWLALKAQTSNGGTLSYELRP